MNLTLPANPHDLPKRSFLIGSFRPRDTMYYGVRTRSIGAGLNPEISERGTLTAYDRWRMWTMPMIDDGSIVAVTLVGYIDGQQTMLTLHYRFSGPNTAWDMVPAFNALNAIWDGIDDLYLAYAGATSVDYVDMEVIMQVVNLTRYRGVRFTPTTNHGTAAGASLPPNVAHAITLNGDLAGRHSRGTKHIGAQPTSFTTDGFLTAGGLAAMNQLRDRLIAEANVFGDDQLFAIPVVYNRADPLNSVVITGGYAQLTTRVERRRTVGLGT